MEETLVKMDESAIYFRQFSIQSYVVGLVIG
jgi:hypothetical protein